MSSEEGGKCFFTFFPVYSLLTPRYLLLIFYDFSLCAAFLAEAVADPVAPQGINPINIIEFTAGYPASAALQTSFIGNDDAVIFPLITLAGTNIGALFALALMTKFRVVDTKVGNFVPLEFD
jgi:hypothetical protein